MELRSSGAACDRRIERTRKAVLDAFRDRLLKDGYGAISSRSLSAAANVGRSTFYEHFANVDQVLAQSLRPMLASLAASIIKAEAAPETARILEHFWNERKMARDLLAGRARGVVAKVFAEQFESALSSFQSGLNVATPAVPRGLAAVYLAEGALALIRAWLSGSASGCAAEIAVALHTSGHASARAFSAKLPA